MDNIHQLLDFQKYGVNHLELRAYQNLESGNGLFRQIILLEEPPMRRQIYVCGPNKQYSVWTPWLYHCFTFLTDDSSFESISFDYDFHGHYLLGSHKQIPKKNFILRRTPLFNLDHDGKVCLGSSKVARKPKGDIATNIIGIINAWWLGRANLDYFDVEDLDSFWHYLVSKSKTYKSCIANESRIDYNSYYAFYYDDNKVDSIVNEAMTVWSKMSLPNVLKVQKTQECLNDYLDLETKGIMGSKNSNNRIFVRNLTSTA